MRTRPLKYLALLGYLVFLAFPLLWLLSTSFKTQREMATLTRRGSRATRPCTTSPTRSASRTSPAARCAA